jgi:hypothetical protein
MLRSSQKSFTCLLSRQQHGWRCVILMRVLCVCHALLCESLLFGNTSRIVYHMKGSPVQLASRLALFSAAESVILPPFVQMTVTTEQLGGSRLQFRPSWRFTLLLQSMLANVWPASRNKPWTPSPRLLPYSQYVTQTLSYTHILRLFAAKQLLQLILWHGAKGDVHY